MAGRVANVCRQRGVANYADVMGPTEVASLVPIRTKPTPWLELHFICLQLLRRLRPI